MVPGLVAPVRPELFLLVAILLLPVALNTHNPRWMEFLGTVPYIRSHSHLLRWNAIGIPIVILIITAVLNSLPFRRIRLGLALLGIVAVPLLNLRTDFSMFVREKYDPRELTAAYLRARASDIVPEVTVIEMQTDDAGRLIGTLESNQRFIDGASSFPCYEPIFGYRLERFPLGALRPGPVFQVTDGVLNLKDPVCYVYGAANRCRPGDHFAANDHERARALVGYRRVPFTRPFGLNVAFAFSALTAMIVMVSLMRLLARGMGGHRQAAVTGSSANRGDRDDVSS
jgi:hypothetical protein